MIAPEILDVNRAVRALVKDATDVVAIPGNDNEAAPTGSYATVLPMRIERPGVDSIIDRRDESTLETHGTCCGFWSIQWYRNNAFEKAVRFHQWCWSSVGIQAIENKGLTFRMCSDVRQLDMIVSQKWESRAGLDFQAGFPLTTTLTTSFIQSVPIHLSTETHQVSIEVS